jgi:hypothetical protein
VLLQSGMCWPLDLQEHGWAPAVLLHGWCWLLAFLQEPGWVPAALLQCLRWQLSVLPD